VTITQPESTDPKDAEIARLRKRLRTCQASLRDVRAELDTRPAKPPAEPLTAAEIRHLHERFVPSPPGTTCATCGRAHPGPCSTCGGLHAHACPRVRSVEYERHGDEMMIRKVEYWRRWSKDGIMFADELPEIPEGG